MQRLASPGPRVILACVLGCAALLLFPQTFPNFGSPNEYSRLHLVSAIVDDRSLSTDGAVARYGEVQDTAFFRGRHYSDKPIGYALPGVPVYAALRMVAGDVTGDSAIRVLRIFANLIPLAFFLPFFHRSVRDEAGAGRWSPVLVVALVFGTLVFVYAQLYISHMVTGLAWFVAWRWVARGTTGKDAMKAGALLGYAFLLEVPSAVTAAVFAVWLLVHRPRHLAAFVAGVALLASPAFVYNAALFGHPLEWAYYHMKDPDQRAGYAAGLAGWHGPSLSVLYELAAGSSRGFFRYMPHLLFGLWGLAAAMRRRKDGWLGLAVVGSSFVFYSGMHNWDGAWCFGPRYLVPVIPFLVWGTGLWLGQRRQDDLPGLCYLALLGMTIPFMLFGAATFPFTPPLDGAMLRLYPTLFWEGLLGPGGAEAAGLGPVAAGTALVVLTLSACILAIPPAAFSRRQRAILLAAILLTLPATFLFERRIASARTPLESYVAGAVGYYQGRHEISRRFLREALARQPEPWLRQQAEHLLAQSEAAGPP